MLNLPLAFALISPLFMVAGLGLISIPIIIHFLNRRRFQTVQWAAMEFLLRAMRKNRRRLRFEQMLLLCTRCAVLLLLGLALARPLGCADSSLAALAGQRAGLHVLVIDNSLSMAYEANRSGAKTHLDQAKIIAKALLKQLSSGGESVAIITSSRPARAVIASPTYDLKSADAAIDRIGQTFSGTDEIGALGMARDVAKADASRHAKTLYLIDDSTRVGWLGNADLMRQLGKELTAIYPGGIEHFNLGKSGQWNHAVVGLSPVESLLTNYFPNDLTADVRGFGPCPVDPKLVWKIDDAVVPPGIATVKAAQEASPVTITANPMGGGLHVISASLLSDNRLALDDTRWRVVDVASQLRVLIVEGERGVEGVGSSGAFLDTALNPPGNDKSKSSYVATERISDLELPSKVLADYRCICLCGVGQIQETMAGQLEKYVRQGGTLMVFMGDPVKSDNYNATLYKHYLIPGPLTRLVTTSGNQRPARFAFDANGVLHPILADFHGHQNTGMETAEFYLHWQVALPADSKVEHVLDFQPVENEPNSRGDPAVTVHSLGGGRVVFYASAADANAHWSNFMSHLGGAYSALMHMLLMGTVNSGDAWMNLTVNDSLIVPPSVHLTAVPILKDAAQTQYPVEQSTDAYGEIIYRSKPLTKPGIYSLATGKEQYKIAVNVPADESDIRTIDDAEVKKALGDIPMRMEGDSVPLNVADSNQGKDMGWNIMLAVLAIAAAECLMAMMFGHHRQKRAQMEGKGGLAR